MSDFYGTDWAAIHQEPAWGDLAKDRAVTGETLRVLLVMLQALDTSNRIRITPRQIRHELGITSAQVTRSTRILVEKGVITDAGIYGWRLNPRYGYKGDPDKGLRRDQNGNLVLVD